MPFVEGRKLKTPRKEKKFIEITFYFTRTGYTEPDMGDIFRESLPEGIIDTYNGKGKSLWILLDFIQKRPNIDDKSGLTDKLNDENWIKSIEHIEIYIRDLDESMDVSIKQKLLDDIKTLQYEELDDLLDSFFMDHGMDEFDSTEKTKYLQTYLNTRI